MERPTPEAIVAALRCCAGTDDGLSCKDCPYLNAGVCKWQDVYTHAADLIEILCGRRAG